MEQWPGNHKQAIRDEVWRSMQEAHVTRFPGARGRIPNFIGAEAAARRAASLDVWARAGVLKCNPDSPQQPLRKLALRQGKVVYMAVPRLSDERCFIELDPEHIDCSLHEAATIKGAFRWGRLVTFGEMRDIDLVVCGSVAVNLSGARVGKGGGYSDLEYALAVLKGKVGKATSIVTTVHALQVLDIEVPMNSHDIPVDVIVTPERIIVSEPVFSRPSGIYWDLLQREKLDSIPELRRESAAQRRSEG